MGFIRLLILFFAPTETFRTLEEAQEYVDETMRGEVLKGQDLEQESSTYTIYRDIG